jgi:hypothetical protein
LEGTPDGSGEEPLTAAGEGSGQKKMALKQLLIRSPGKKLNNEEEDDE